MDEPVDPPGAWPVWVETWILPYVDDFALWPVLVALLGHVLVVMVPLEIALVRGPSMAAAAVLAAMLAATGELVRMEWKARGRPGLLTAIGVGMWTVSVPCAYYAGLYGIF